VFKKNENQEIGVYHEVDGKLNDFSYIEMIKYLIKSKKLKQPEISGGFTDAEVKSIKSMITHINKQVTSS